MAEKGFPIRHRADRHRIWGRFLASRAMASAAIIAIAKFHQCAWIGSTGEAACPTPMRSPVSTLRCRKRAWRFVLQFGTMRVDALGADRLVRADTHLSPSTRARSSAESSAPE